MRLKGNATASERERDSVSPTDGEGGAARPPGPYRVRGARAPALARPRVTLKEGERETLPPAQHQRR